MPTLRRYQDRDSHYVLTSIGGQIITFQLTARGLDKLISAGVTLDKRPKFPRALLLSLIRSGDAFTRGSGVDPHSTAFEGQLELDFADDPEAETAFPVCDACPSREDLHLVLVREKKRLEARICCAQRCVGESKNVDTSVPVALLDLSLISRLMDLKQVRNKSAGTTRFETLLRAEFDARWDEFRRTSRPSQQALFEGGQAGELDLTPRRKRP